MHGGSGSLVVEEAAEPEPEESRWIGEEELGSFEMNVPTESKPSRNHVVCCTGNSSIQVGDRGGVNRRRSCCRWLPAAVADASPHHQDEDVDAQVRAVLPVVEVMACKT